MLPPLARSIRGKARHIEDVAGRDHIGAAKPYDAVAIRSGVGHVDQFDPLAVEEVAQLHDSLDVGFGGLAVAGHLRIDKSQQGFFGGENGCVIIGESAGEVAGDVASGEGLAGFGDLHVAAGVFRGNGGVGEVANRLGRRVTRERLPFFGDILTQLPDRGQHLIGHLRQTRINHEDAVRTDRQGDVRARAGQQVDVAANGHDFNVLGRCEACHPEKKGTGE